MPTIQIPLQPWDAIPKLKRSREFERLAAEKITLKERVDEAKVRLDGDDKQGIESLSAELYLLLDAALPDGVSSVEFNGYMLTKIDSGESSKFDKQKLMQLPIPCVGCKECKRKKVTLFVTAKDIEACTSKGTRKPTVSAEKIKSKNWVT